MKMNNTIRSTVIPVLLGAVFLLGGYTSVSAQTSSPSVQELIATLQKQIETLKAQIKNLEAAQAGVASASSDVRATLKIIAHLKEGMSGEEVRLLQVALASDADVYPEARITGHYGKLTARAVKRFQKKHNLEQVGQVGPKTLRKLNEELEKNAVAKEDDDDDEDRDGDKKRFCAAVPPGHLIAPGWLRKHDGVRPILPPCQILPPGMFPPGIDTKIGRATSTPPEKATTTPRIKNVVTSDITANSAHVIWNTSEAATSKVWYGTTTPVSLSSALRVSSNTLTMSHDSTLSGLSTSTTYYYMVSSADAAGNNATSSEQSFQTLGE